MHSYSSFMYTVMCNLQRESLFQFVAALKACPVHFAVDRVEFWCKRAANNGQNITQPPPSDLSSQTKSSAITQPDSPDIRISPHRFLQHGRVRVVDRTVLWPALTPVHLVVGHWEAPHFGPWILGAPGLDVKRRRRGCHSPCTGWVEVTGTCTEGSGRCQGMRCCA